MNSRRMIPALLLATALTVAGCTGSETENPTDPTSSPAITESPLATQPPTEPSTDPSPDQSPDQNAGTPTSEAAFDTEAKQTEGFPDLGEVDLLPTQVRVGEHDGYQRVVVEFEGPAGSLGYRASYVDQANHPGSGEPILVDGEYTLEVVITGTRMPEPDEEFAAGPTDVEPDQAITGVMVSPPYEGQSQVVIGTDAERGFRVSVEANPTRLVIDVQND